ncbi:MAG: fatty acid desaturase [Candidatus Sericytochromatia bacterium]|nr:fatty acid desaturase [Candidatus Sericytochromatia bacterium]
MQRRNPAWLRECMAQGKHYHWIRKAPLGHNLLNVGIYAATFALIAATIAAGGRFHPGLYIPVASLIFALSFFSLFILVVHEASHDMFVIAKDNARRRFWNRVFGWSVALPFGVHYIRHWEEGHTIHHLHPIEAEDPQAFNRITGPALWKMAAIFLIVPGYAFVHRIISKRSVTQTRTGPGVLIGFFAVWVPLMVLTGALIAWTVPVALLLGLQITLVLNQFKGALEHGGEIAFEPNPLLRSRTSFFPFRNLLMPWNITLHFEHHLNFSVPWYDLVRYHRDIRGLVPAELQSEIFNRDILAQLNGRKGRLPVIENVTTFENESAAARP